MTKVKWIKGELVGEEGTIAICPEHADDKPGVIQELSETVEQEQEVFCVHCRKFLGFVDPYGPDPLKVLN